MAKLLPSNLTQGELDQAQHLIFKGKAHAAQGDPRMQRIVNYLSAKGYQDALSHVRKMKQVEAGVVKTQEDLFRESRGLSPGADISKFKSTQTESKKYNLFKIVVLMFLRLYRLKESHLIL